MMMMMMVVVVLLLTTSVQKYKTVSTYVRLLAECHTELRQAARLCKSGMRISTEFDHIVMWSRERCHLRCLVLCRQRYIESRSDTGAINFVEFLLYVLLQLS